MAGLSLLGSPDFGGLGVIPAGWDMLVVSITSLCFYHWGVRSGHRTDYLKVSTLFVQPQV
jgi:hypothetical protein